MNGANLPVFLLEVNGGLILYVTCSFKQKRVILLRFSTL